VTGRERILVDGVEVEIQVPVSGSENVMLPVIRVIVRQAGHARGVAPILLQRRDNESEPVRGRIELPGGRWRSGESPALCAVREVAEETGVTVSGVEGVVVADGEGDGSLVVVNPLVVVAGIDGRLPAVHVVLTAVGAGSPVPESGLTTDVRWWSLEDVQRAVESDPNGFIPSSRAALVAYLAAIDSDT